MVFHLFPKPTAAVMRVKTAAFGRYGAKVLNDLNSSVSHVLVKLVAGKVPSLAEIEGPWLIVNEKWASDSIDSKKVLDTGPYMLAIKKPSGKSSGKKAAINPETAALPPTKRTARHSSSSSQEESVKAHAKRSKVADSEPVSPPASSPPVSPVDNTNNRFVLEVFQELASNRKSGGNSFSNAAYLRAIRRIEASGKQLKGYNDAISIGLSPKLSQLIDDVCRGRIPESIRGATAEKSAVLALFQTLYSVGPRTALDFYNHGYRTLDDIREHCKEPNVQVSLDHHADFVERISRFEVAQHYSAVKTILAELDAEAVALCMGSYRRGEPDCGDIDVIVTKPGAQPPAVKKLVTKLVAKMFETGLAKYTFGGGSSSRRWLGATALEHGKWRRMDILGVPDAELGASLIYYTGNELFNRKLRLRAGKMGMRLNERGLFDRATDKLIESQDEKRIFSLLKTPWREPTDRNIY